MYVVSIFANHEVVLIRYLRGTINCIWCLDAALHTVVTHASYSGKIVGYVQCSLDLFEETANASQDIERCSYV